MIKRAVGRLVKAVSFCCVTAMLICLCSYMLAPKDNTPEGGIINPSANGFFSEPKNSVEIAVIGNSDAYSGFSPMELWKTFGYTSYVSAEGHQSLAQSYAQLKKMTECHDIKLVILETDEFFVKSGLTEGAMRLANAYAGSVFSVFWYHDRWKTVKPRELLKKPNYTAHCATKGQMLSNEINGYTGGEYMVKTDKREEIPLSTLVPLEMIVSHCRENGIKLMLVEIPSQTSWNYERHNAVNDFAEKNGLPFLDLNIDRESFGFDWKTDTRDNGNHLNSLGARKCTRYIGDYLMKNYKLTDYRRDPAYEQWNRDYEEYKKAVKI